MSFVCCISTTLFSEFSVVCKTNVIWFGVDKCFQDHWKKNPILVYIILSIGIEVDGEDIQVKKQQTIESKSWLVGLCVLCRWVVPVTSPAIKHPLASHNSAIFPVPFPPGAVINPPPSLPRY